MLNIGCHLSASKGYLNMGQTALSIGANTFQYFSRNPRGGNAKAFDADDAAALVALAGEHGFAPVLTHAPYTLNPCAASEATLDFAHRALSEDLARLEAFPGALYLLFLNAFGSIPLACALSFACCIPIVQLRRRFRGRMSARQAAAVLERWAYGPDDEAREQIGKLLKVDVDSLVYLPRHASASISAGDVFSAWKSHRGRERVVLAAPCHADGKARILARTLREPAVEIADAARLIPLIRRSEIAAPRAPGLRGAMKRLRLSFAALPDRRPWRQNVLFGALLLPVYLLTGNPAYLLLALAALLLAGIALRPRRLR